MSVEEFAKRHYLWLLDENEQLKSQNTYYRKQREQLEKQYAHLQRNMMTAETLSAWHHQARRKTIRVLTAYIRFLRLKISDLTKRINNQELSPLLDAVGSQQYIVYNRLLSQIDNQQRLIIELQERFKTVQEKNNELHLRYERLVCDITQRVSE